MMCWVPSSLTARLGLLFALLATLTFSLVGSFLHQSLQTQLEVHDDQDLRGKVGQIRHLLAETQSAKAIQIDPHRFTDTAAGHGDLILILKAADGTILFQNRPNLGGLPVLALAHVDKLPELESLRSWKLTTGQTARTVGAWGNLGAHGPQVQIIVARTDVERRDLLRTYRTSTYAAVGAGAMLSALLGYFLVRRGLRPVHAMATQAQSITAQRLSTRLDTAAAPDELQTLAQSFNAMLDRLFDSFQRLSQFSADLAHDLRTPINNLMVQTQVALSQHRSAEEYEILLMSNVEEYERLARMVENMLFLARADHAQMSPDKEVLDLPNELQRIADYFEGVADDANVRIEVDAGGVVLADGVMFRRAVNNLVANAIRYTPQGGLIQLVSTESADMTTIAVSNTGHGIDLRHVHRLFDRFYRVDRARSDSASLSGLGLAIVQSIMVLHHGRAEVESIPGQVTTFRLQFPKMP